jgi:hypothetical protein
MATRLNGAGDLPNVCDTLFRGGEEMKYGTVMPDVISPRLQLDLSDVRDQPMNSLRDLPQPPLGYIDRDLGDI